jgi:hypothetical protein
MALSGYALPRFGSFSLNGLVSGTYAFCQH